MFRRLPSAVLVCATPMRNTSSLPSGKVIKEVGDPMKTNWGEYDKKSQDSTSEHTREGSFVAFFRHNPEMWARVKTAMCETTANSTSNARTPEVSSQPKVISKIEPLPPSTFADAERFSHGVDWGKGHHFVAVDIANTKPGESLYLPWTKIPGTDFVVQLRVFAHIDVPLKAMYRGDQPVLIGKNLSLQADSETRLVFSFPPNVQKFSQEGKKIVVCDSDGKLNEKGQKTLFALCDSYPGTAIKMVVIKESPSE